MKNILLIILLTLAASQTITINFGCKTYAENSQVCKTCSQYFYLDSQGICQPVSSTCATYDQLTGACLSCYSGYLFLPPVCIPAPASQDPNCANYTSGVCTKCSRGFYLQDNVCQMVDPLCKTFNYEKLLCTACYSGYALANNTCVVKQAQDNMPGCAAYNDSVCVRCSRNFYMDAQGNCQQVNSVCNTFDPMNGNCLTCFSGYQLTNNICTISATPSDPYCSRFQGSLCVQCSNGYYFNKAGQCQQIDPFCKTFDNSSLVCTNCYSGFQLVNGACTFSSTTPAYDPNCKIFNTSNNNQCLNCSQGFYFGTNNLCTQIDPSCKNFNLNSLKCTDCYSGYNLVNGACQEGDGSAPSQANCAQTLDGVCVKCVLRAYYDIDNNCVMASDLCDTFNTFNGYCTSCFSGYALNSTDGTCKPSLNAVCTATNARGVCTKCSNGYYLDAQSDCQAIDNFCQTFNYTTFLCTACYKGYVLNANNQCGLAPVVTASIQNCVVYDSTGQACIKCFNLYYVSNNQCVAVNPLCKSFDPSNGDCLTCYSNFSLKSGQCVYK